MKGIRQALDEFKNENADALASARVGDGGEGATNEGEADNGAADGTALG